jgi:hypothetical protein
VRSAWSAPCGANSVFDVSNQFYLVQNKTLYCDSESRFLVSILLPCLYFNVFLLLVDSGACCTCVSTKFAKSKNFVINEAYADTLYSACGRELGVRGAIVLVICFAPKQYMKVKAHVIDAQHRHNFWARCPG